MQSKTLPQETRLTLKRLEQRLLRLRNENRRFALVGIGSDDHADDAAGRLVARALLPLPLASALIIDGGTAPENATGEIKQFDPALVIFVDALRSAGPAGVVREVSPEEITGLSFSTHSLPLSVILDYLKQTTSAEFVVLGIQGANFEFGREVSAEVLMAVRATVDSVMAYAQNGEADE